MVEVTVVEVRHEVELRKNEATSGTHVTVEVDIV
jgi:hypothetical protein